MSAMKDLYIDTLATEQHWPANWHVLPIYEWTHDGCACGQACGSPGKHPRTRNGLKNASNNPKQHQRWREWAPRASWAVRTGPESNLVVVDLDVDKGGLESWEQLLIGRKRPRTVVARTGSGGQHWYFQHPGERVPNSVGKLGAGIDTRGDNGYVLLPGSTHPLGAYEWMMGSSPNDVEVAVLPDWLLGAL